ncbi:uncharacterized protein F5147DRAFT_773265 [Suillus discolor]|uniref:Uncharacterized protein n=1 Tax=Suillus discolor TaxID=1912936 RepID=A0A9P7F7E8_9AGAM|nr:uncharacterized protein F5147DRAFT_773265 [Suillus discolor]KAG2108934.1 hypothetical protein F5147DRAFT_773265 [Suillus discolor]
MYHSMPYNFLQQDSELYPHIKASNAERLQTTTDYGQSTSQPQQYLPRSVLEDSSGNSTPTVSHHYVACDDVLDACILPIPIGQGDIQSDAAGWYPRHVSSSYPPCAFSDCLTAHIPMGFSDANFRHDPRHPLQEEVYPHPQYMVNDDKSESHVDRASVCQWDDGYGICGRTINVARTGEHMTSYHFKSPLPANSRLACLWKGCELYKPVRRDTIIRHIIEKHLGLKYRSKHWLASHTGTGFCGSRKNACLR